MTISPHVPLLTAPVTFRGVDLPAMTYRCRFEIPSWNTRPDTPTFAWYTLPETNIPPETLGWKMSFSLGRPPTRCHVKVLGSVWGKSCFEMKMKGIWNYGIEIPRTNVRNIILWKLSSGKSKRIPCTPSLGVSLWTPSKIICLSGNP